MRFLCLAALLLPALQAQDFTGRIKMKPLLPPINQPWNSIGAKPIFRIAAPPAETSPCSIPLLPVNPVETDAAMVVPPPSGNFAGRVVTLAAPPCKAIRR
jgi:hypothetical protein